MQKISPHLWFDKEAKEAAQFYISLFENSKITSDVTLHDTPSGDAAVVTIELAGQTFTLLNGGPLFTFTPALSFIVRCKTVEEVESLWEKLSVKPLMELKEYPFNKRYGWTADKFGLTWQFMVDEADFTQKITPAFLFVQEQFGKCQEAMTFYTSVFHNANIGDIARYGGEMGPDVEGKIMYAEFTLEGQDFIAMEGPGTHNFTFNEAVSLMVSCENQAEIDYYWEKLSAVSEAEQCGWLKDKYGVSWQIVPSAMGEMMSQNDPAKMARVTEAFLKMKKFDIAELEKAAEGK